MCSLASKLKYLRESRQLTKKEVADAVGVHPSSIGNLEKGSIPQADLLYLLSQFFNVNMEYFMNTNTKEIEYTQSYDSLNLNHEESTMLNLYKRLSLPEKNEIKDLMEFKIFKHNHQERLSSSQEKTNSFDIA